jgi:hypothetical protein
VWVNQSLSNLDPPAIEGLRYAWVRNSYATLTKSGRRNTNGRRSCWSHETKPCRRSFLYRVRQATKLCITTHYRGYAEPLQQPAARFSLAFPLRQRAAPRSIPASVNFFKKFICKSFRIVVRSRFLHPADRHNRLLRRLRSGSRADSPKLSTGAASANNDDS